MAIPLNSVPGIVGALGGVLGDVTDFPDVDMADACAKAAEPLGRKGVNEGGSSGVDDALDE
jgi:hypothetical protein